MSLKSALYSYLTGLSGITSVVGTRIYPDIAPEGAATPYIVYRYVSSEHVRSMTGASDFGSRRVQFDAYGSSADSVESVFDALRDALEAKRGQVGDEDLSILSSGIDSERDEYIDPTDGSQVGKHRRSIDFIIWHRL